MFIKIIDVKNRKKVLDFYQRTSLTAYCTAFSYRPLPLPPDKSFSEIYLELPADCHQLYSKLCRSPIPHPWTSTTHSVRHPQFHSSGKYILHSLFLKYFPHVK